MINTIAIRKKLEQEITEEQLRLLIVDLCKELENIQAVHQFAITDVGNLQNELAQLLSKHRGIESILRGQTSAYGSKKGGL